MSANGNSESDDAEPGGWTYKDWYSRNKKALAERRKARYQKDRKYRKKKLANSKRYKDRIIAEEVEAGIREEAPIRPPPKERAPVVASINLYGKAVLIQMVFVGTFAAEIGKSVHTIYHWERKGLLPKTPFYTKRGPRRERLYTLDMIKVVRKELRKRNNIVFAQDPTFYDDVANGWALTGIEMEEDDAQGQDEGREN